MRVKYLARDMETRIHGGIAFYRGEPRYVEVVDRNQVRLSSLTGAVAPIIVGVADENLDVSSPPLGYINYSGHANYVMRRPERRFKQVVNAQNLICERVMTGTYVGPDQLNNMLFSREGEDMLMGRYPSVKDAIERMTLNKKVISVAISRDIAIARDSFGTTRVYNKLEQVGYLREGTNTVVIPKHELAWVISKCLEGYDWTVE
jgi:hypothetical protein